MNWYDRNAVSDSAISPPPALIYSDFLYLSSAPTAGFLPHLLAANITHVINISSCSDFWEKQQDITAEWARLRTCDRRLYATCVKKYGNSCNNNNNNNNNIPFNYTAPKYLHIDVEDTEETDLKPYFSQCIRYIQDIRRQSPNSRILVHCYQGRSRSASIVIAYIMYAAKLGYDEAYKFVKDRRSSVAPNQSFVKQLRAFDAELRARRLREQEQRDSRLVTGRNNNRNNNNNDNNNDDAKRAAIESARKLSVMAIYIVLFYFFLFPPSAPRSVLPFSLYYITSNGFPFV